LMNRQWEKLFCSRKSIWLQ